MLLQFLTRKGERKVRREEWFGERRRAAQGTGRFSEDSPCPAVAEQRGFAGEESQSPHARAAA
jgi:hypothetical protein